MTVTSHGAEIAVPGQHEITLRAAHGELEIGQEYDGEFHAVYAQPDNVLTLIGAMLRKCGMDDVRLYRESSGGLCQDIELPEPLPKDRTAAERQRRYRQRKRDGVTPSVTPKRNAPQLIAAE